MLSIVPKASAKMAVKSPGEEKGITGGAVSSNDPGPVESTPKVSSPKKTSMAISPSAGSTPVKKRKRRPTTSSSSSSSSSESESPSRGRVNDKKKGTQNKADTPTPKLRERVDPDKYVKPEHRKAQILELIEGDYQLVNELCRIRLEELDEEISERVTSISDFSLGYLCGVSHTAGTVLRRILGGDPEP
jgi:hypothetical protein